MRGETRFETGKCFPLSMMLVSQQLKYADRQTDRKRQKETEKLNRETQRDRQTDREEEELGPN